MANIKSQIKRIRQTRKATLRNKSRQGYLKTLISNFNKAVVEKNKDRATELYKQTARTLDKAAASGIIHSNRAASKKSTLSKRLTTLK